MSNTELTESNNQQTLREGPTDTTDSVNKADGEEVEMTKEEDILLKQLALQLEYYFSKQNLSTDTYVQTLRSLNDGCVPVRILANFGKVKSIIALDPTFLNNEETRIYSVLSAIRKGYTTLLEINSIDAITGKIVPSKDEIPGKTIWAVGPVSKEPLDVDPLATSPRFCNRPISTAMAPIANTIILREVVPSVTEEEVRALFLQIPDCPTVTSVVRDVANCWFITFDSDTRVVMMNIMMQLRSMTLGSEYVLARLKASTTSITDVDLFSPLVVPADNAASLHSSQGSDGSKRKKKKSRPKKSRSKKQFPDVSTDSENGCRNGSEKVVLPSLTSDHFPSLQHDNKVEWETPPDDARHPYKGVDDDSKSEQSGESPESKKGFSDGASTATTTSSSLESVPKKIIPMGGYAAALLKPPAAKPSITRSLPDNKACSKQASSVVKENSAPEKKAVTASVPGWGQRRSFADILRQDKIDAISS